MDELRGERESRWHCDRKNEMSGTPLSVSKDTQKNEMSGTPLSVSKDTRFCIELSNTNTRSNAHQSLSVSFPECSSPCSRMYQNVSYACARVRVCACAEVRARACMQEFMDKRAEQRALLSDLFVFLAGIAKIPHWGLDLVFVPGL